MPTGVHQAKPTPVLNGAPAGGRPKKGVRPTRPRPEMGPAAQDDGWAPLFAPVQEADTDLAALAREINAAHDAGEAANRKKLEHYRQAGDALIAARKGCERQGRPWLKWLRENVRWSQARAYHYIELAEVLVTRTLTPEEQEAEWRRISGNGPRGERDQEPGADEGEEDGEKDKDKRKKPSTGPNLGDGEDDTPSGQRPKVLPKQYSLSIAGDRYKEFVTLLRRVGKAFGTEDDAATVIEALRRCDEEVSRG